MKRLTYLILVVIIVVFYEGVVSFAVISEEASPDDVIDSVVEQRQKAKQEYKAYKLQRESEKKATKKIAPIQVQAPMASERDAPDPRRKNDIMIGMGLILVAIILSIYVHQLSKKKQSQGGDRSHIQRP